jgi:hypothetical protein
VQITDPRQPKRPNPPSVLGAVPSRVEVSTSVISKMFQLARSSASAKIQLANAREAMEKYKALRAKGMIPSSEVRAAEAKVMQLQHEVDLNKVEFEAIAEALHRDLGFAREMQQDAMQTQRRMQQGSRDGEVSRDRMAEAIREVMKATKVVADAEANVEQLETAMELVERLSAQRGNDDPTSPTQERESPPEKTDEEAP